jgi:hypothetical protein
MRVLYFLGFLILSILIPVSLAQAEFQNERNPAKIDHPY